MKIRASVPDETTYLALFMGGLNFFNSLNIYADNINNIEFYYVVASSVLFGAIIGNFFMRIIGWILPEKHNQKG